MRRALDKFKGARLGLGRMIRSEEEIVLARAVNKLRSAKEAAQGVNLGVPAAVAYAVTCRVRNSVYVTARAINTVVVYNLDVFGRSYRVDVFLAALVGDTSVQGIYVKVGKASLKISFDKI